VCMWFTYLIIYFNEAEKIWKSVSVWRSYTGNSIGRLHWNIFWLEILSRGIRQRAATYGTAPCRAVPDQVWKTRETVKEPSYSALRCIASADAVPCRTPTATIACSLNARRRRWVFMHPSQLSFHHLLCMNTYTLYSRI